MRRRLWLVAAGLLGLSAIGVVRADGEVGLLIQNGDTIETYCLAFEGDSVGGEVILDRAGITIEQFGGSGGRTVCALDDVGCFDAGSFNDCFCQCEGGTCTYWAFFTQRYGAGWVYSSIAFNLTRSRDGDLQGWKWGRGGSQSAPVPAAASFEAICGHPPRGGADVTTVSPSPTGTATPNASTETPASPTETRTTSASGTAAASPAASPASPSATGTSPATGGWMTMAPAGSPATVTITVVSRTGTAQGVPATGPSGEDDASGPGGLFVFAGVAAVLAAGVGAAVVVRRRRGA